MRIAIVGWGLEAQSAYRFFGPEHDYLIVNESSQDNFPPQSERLKTRFLETNAPIGISGQVADLSYLEGIDEYDKIVYQPTAYFNLKKVYGDNKDFWDKATTVYDIFLENVASKNIVGVTGTKGKGTTSTLIAKMLEANGQKVHLGGNIGTPILDLLPDIKSDNWVVWELANFQLKTASHSPHIAVCLMIAKEHQDWHPDMEDYVEAKANIFRHQSKDDIAIYFAGDVNSEHIAGYSQGNKIPYFDKPGARLLDEGVIVIGEEEQKIIDTSEIKLLGDHNLQNVCAAVTAVWQVHQNTEAIRNVLSTFTGLEHRLEFVRELNDVSYYDDSFGTTPETAVVAMKSFSQPIVLIVGGHDKGADYEALAGDIIKDRVRHVIAIGQIAQRISTALREKGFKNITYGLTTMPEIVAESHRVAQPGDVVLLSAATSSFGLFNDYKDRGNQFKNSVKKLA